jgi:hypothetical protein
MGFAEPTAKRERKTEMNSILSRDKGEIVEVNGKETPCEYI